MERSEPAAGLVVSKSNRKRRRGQPAEWPESHSGASQSSGPSEKVARDFISSVPSSGRLPFGPAGATALEVALLAAIVVIGAALRLGFLSRSAVEHFDEG